jgi:hypothetical protein
MSIVSFDPKRSGPQVKKGEHRLTPVRKALIAVALVGSTLGGGALGAALVNTGASAATTTTTPSSSSSSSTAATPAAPSGTFHSNENAAHEQTESAAREAQENAGQVPTVP